MVHQRREDARFELAVAHPGAAEELDAVAELAGKVDVHLVEVADAFDGHFRIGIVHAPCEADKQHELVRGVEPVDVQRGIGLGVALFLRFGEGRGEVDALAGHFRKDIVAGAVQNAFERSDMVPGKAFLQRLDDGDAARHAGFIEQSGALFVGQPEQAFAFFREQGLVGGDDLFALCEAARDELLGRVDAAHQLDDHVNVGIVGKGHGIGRQAHALRKIAFTVRIADGDSLQIKVAAGAGPDFFGVFGQQAHKAAADGSESGQSDIQGRIHQQMSFWAEVFAEGTEVPVRSVNLYL